MGKLLVVSNEASALHDPGEGPLHDPAAADDDETLHPRHAAYDLEGDVGLALRPGDQLAGIAAVCEDALDEGKAPPGSLQHALCSVAILNIGAVHLDREQPAIGIRQDMTLAPVDALSGVVTFGSPF
jgi:hypothetical protein